MHKAYLIEEQMRRLFQGTGLDLHSAVDTAKELSRVLSGGPKRTQKRVFLKAAVPLWRGQYWSQGLLPPNHGWRPLLGMTVT